MKIAKLVSGLGVIAMAVVLIHGFTAGDFLADGAVLLQNPWGVVSMVDLYTGFILFSLWIGYREGNVVKSVVWIILMLVLGFFAGSLYVFLALDQSKGNWKKFWLGRHG
jgi:hypothetical protein